MAWIYLLLASLFEILWTFSLKFLQVSRLKAITWHELFRRREDLLALVPLAGYIVFGVGNIIFFSQAMKEIPASTALAVWMGITLVGVKILDMTLFKESYNLYQFVYMGLILIGIVGLKKN
ncbi:MAG: SMR family transporter [Puia sp.]|nr:SMR family transporter [Puia sp.]